MIFIDNLSKSKDLNLIMVIFMHSWHVSTINSMIIGVIWPDEIPVSMFDMMFTPIKDIDFKGRIVINNNNETIGVLQNENFML